MIFEVLPILPGEFWGSRETPIQELLTEFQHSIEVNVPPRTQANWSVSLAVPANLASCKFILVRVDGSGRTPLAPLYTGPFLMLERYQSSFKLQIGTRQEVIIISCLKPAFTPAYASPAQPLKRGCPRKQPPVQSTPAKRGRGRPPLVAPVSPVPPGQHTRSGRSFALLPPVSDWRGGPVEDDISSLCRLHFPDLSLIS